MKAEQVWDRHRPDQQIVFRRNLRAGPVQAFYQIFEKAAPAWSSRRFWDDYVQPAAALSNAKVK